MSLSGPRALFNVLFALGNKLVLEAACVAGGVLPDTRGGDDSVVEDSLG